MSILEDDVLNRYKKKIEMCEGFGNPFNLRKNKDHADRIEDAPAIDCYDVSYYLTENTWKTI